MTIEAIPMSKLRIVGAVAALLSLIGTAWAAGPDTGAKASPRAAGPAAPITLEQRVERLAARVTQLEAENAALRGVLRITADEVTLDSGERPLRLRSAKDQTFEAGAALSARAGTNIKLSAAGTLNLKGSNWSN